MSLYDAAALAALLSLLVSLVRWMVGGVRHAVAVEHRYVQLLREAEVRTGRQSRRCPFCGGWFNSTELQDAHERDCDQRPTDPTPAEVLALALPPHYASRNHPLSTDTAEIFEVDPRLVGHHRRGWLGRWSG